MSDSTKTVLRDALQLPPDGRAALIDDLIASLDRPDPAIDALWVREAEDRMAAYRAGELDAVDAEQVFAELGRRD